MSERSLDLLLQDILESIQNIKTFTAGLSFAQYNSDLKTQHAVERNFSIIGESVSRLPSSFIQKYPGIDWRKIKDFRNFLIHDYFGIDNSIVWNITTQYLDGLEMQIAAIIENLKEK